MPKTLGLTFILLTVLLLSCEKTIEFKPRDQETKIVVDASIENGRCPVVYLTSSFNFFSTISVSQLQGIFIRNAVIKISNGEQTTFLKEFTQSATGGSVYFYTCDTLDDSFVGEQGKTYTLDINIEGNEYTSTTTIPVLTKKIDVLYFEGNVDEKDTSKVILYGIFNDPEGFGNYTRYFTQVNDKPFYPGLNSVQDDQVTDGKKYKLQIEQGVDRNTSIDFQEYSFFHRGDKVTVKYCDIDKATFDFWRTMEYSYSSIGNPFSSPTKVQGNISNGALGYFGGYAVQYSRILIPD
ncbi:MAG: DUF4249 domain-containing protein [Flavitalea sp.]